MQNRKTTINALSSTIQVMIMGAAYFFLYKFLLNELGAKLLGVWSLILSTSSIANLANFGFASGIVKYIAEYNATNNQKNIKKLVFTSTICIGGCFLVFGLVILIVLPHVLSYFVESKYISIATTILPFSLLSLVINAIGGIYTSVLDGLQMNYLKNIIYTLSMLLFVVLCFTLAPSYRLLGIAYAQVIQSSIVLITSYLTYTKQNFGKDNAGYFSWKWDTPIFKSLISYGSKFQLISICQMFYDPVTKIFISKFAGVQSVAYYEMANRLVTQFRGLIISANQVMIPIIATAALEGKDQLRKIYISSVSIICFIEIPLITFVIIMAPLISQIWIGHIQLTFLIFLYMLLFVTFIHILNGPAYFGLLGEGNLRGLLKISIIEVCVNFVLAYILGKLIPNYGAALGGSITIVTATLFMSSRYQRELNVKFKNIFNKSDLIFMFVGLLISLSSLGFNIYFLRSENAFLVCGISFFIFVVLFTPLILMNEKFQKLKSSFLKLK